MPTILVSTAPLTIILVEISPSMSSTAVAPSSVYALLCSIVISAEPIRLTVGGIVSTGGISIGGAIGGSIGVEISSCSEGAGDSAGSTFGSSGGTETVGIVSGSYGGPFVGSYTMSMRVVRVVFPT